MKIRYDFVTNSSSTSFVVINDGEFNLKDFVNSIGIKKDSPFIHIYKGLFEAFKDNMKPARQYYYDQISYGNYDDFNTFITKYFSKETVQKILEAEAQGKKVYIGELSSDNGEIEGFFCTDSFIIESEKLYIDAVENGW